MYGVGVAITTGSGVGAHAAIEVGGAYNIGDVCEVVVV